MPSPSTSLATLRPDLAGSFEQFDLEMDRQSFIGMKVAPVIDVPKASGTFGKITLASLLQARTTARAPGSGYNRQMWEFTSDTFSTKENGAEEAVDDREAQLYSNYFVAEQLAARRALDVVLRNYEQRIAAAIFNTTTWTGSSLTTSVSTPWSTVASATPITDVEAAVQKVYDNSGLKANALIVSWKTFRNLRNNTTSGQIIDRIKYNGQSNTSQRGVSLQVLAEAFDLDYIFVAGASKNSANEGQTGTISPVWSSTQAMVCRVATTSDIKEACIARTFHWAEDGSSIGGTVESYRDETVRSNVVRARLDTDEQVLYAAAGPPAHERRVIPTPKPRTLTARRRPARPAPRLPL
jgi:hypothetical protein